MLENSGDSLHLLARHALSVLRAQGVRGETGTVRAALTHGEGLPLEVTYRGPDLPDAVPEPVADYAMVAAQPPGWQGAHRLVVRAPLVVFDLCWNRDEPLRVLGFSRGEWEAALTEADR